MKMNTKPDHHPRVESRWESGRLRSKIYKASPWYVQNVLISAYGCALHRHATGEEVQRYLARLMDSQWLSPDELSKLQVRKLRDLINHAYANVPYYHELFNDLRLTPEDIETPADLTKLPMLTKEEVRRNRDRLLARNLSNTRMIRLATSGTTGTPLEVYVTKQNEAFERALWLRMRRWAGWQPGDRRATFSGFPVVPFEGRKLPLWRYDWPERRLFFSVYHMTRDNIGLYVKRLREFNPKVIEGYPSYLSYLALHLERSGKTLPVRAVFTFSETLYSDQRTVIEERFECKVFDWWGLTERAASACHCEFTDGYHVNAEKSIIEIIKLDGDPAFPGELGEIVGTNLEEYGMPMIRYRSGDMSSYRLEQCPCGRNLPLIDQIQTRVDQIITTPDGRFINPAPLAALFRHDEIEKAQIIQETESQIVVKMVTSDRYPRSASQPIMAGIRSIVGPHVKISIEFVDEIPRNAAGKYPFVISMVPLEV